jgi:hypothetical protein
MEIPFTENPSQENGNAADAPVTTTNKPTPGFARTSNIGNFWRNTLGRVSVAPRTDTLNPKSQMQGTTEALQQPADGAGGGGEVCGGEWNSWLNIVSKTVGGAGDSTHTSVGGGGRVCGGEWNGWLNIISKTVGDAGESTHTSVGGGGRVCGGEWNSWLNIITAG